MRSERDERVEMDMTPMIDVSFQLLIFFILTLNISIREGNLSSYLPPDKGPNPDTTNPVQLDSLTLTLSLAPGGDATTIELQGRTIQKWKHGADVPEEDRERVGRRARSAYRTVNQQADESAAVKVDVSDQVPAGHAVLVLDTLKKHILTDPAFDQPTLEWERGPRSKH